MESRSSNRKAIAQKLTTSPIPASPRPILPTSAEHPLHSPLPPPKPRLLVSTPLRFLHAHERRRAATRVKFLATRVVAALAEIEPDHLVVRAVHLRHLLGLENSHLRIRGCRGKQTGGHRQHSCGKSRQERSAATHIFHPLPEKYCLNLILRDASFLFSRSSG